MIVWGGFSSAADYQQSGGRYDPATDRWQPTATTGAPAGRYEHSVVWTGSEMIVWGGYNGSVLNDGARYSPVSNAWRTVFTSGAPGARQ
jgi:N-acetylneuraminic acid mutarotase